MTIDDDDLRRLLEATEILTAHAESPLPARLAEISQRLFHGNHFALDHFKDDGGHEVVHNVPFDTKVTAIVAEHGPRIILRDHPMAKAILGRSLAVGRLSDVTSGLAFEQTELYREIYRTVDVRYQLVTPIRTSFGLATLAVHRDMKDFTDRELGVAQRFARTLERAYATELLLGQRASRSNDESETAMAEDLARRGITKRESTVLFWLSQGKRNAEIAIILNISMRTVEVHLASAYRKLGVENRVAALLEIAASRG